MKKHTKLLILSCMIFCSTGCEKQGATDDDNSNPNGFGSTLDQLEITIENQSGLPDDSIFFSCMGNQGAGQNCNVCWVDANNQVTKVKLADNNVLINGKYYTNYSHTCTEVKVIKLDSLRSARIRFSIGKPLRMQIITPNPNAGYTDANWNDPNDPNNSIIYDKVEFTYFNGGLYVNTTSVDYFGIPYTISDSAENFHIGMAATREQVFNYFKNQAPAEFQVLVQGNARIVAPNKLDIGFNQHYFDPYIDSVWTKYKTDSLIMTDATRSSWRAAGIVEDDNVFDFSFTSEDASFNNKTVKINKPSSSNVFGCDGELHTDGSRPIPEQKLIPKIAGALNRSVLYGYDYQNACDTSTFYKNGTTNWFSKILHKCSIDNKCYGFPYDDDCDQSSLFPSTQIRKLKITITKFN
nr:hypothetical protein [Bacteroidota bacterium]